MQFSPEALFFRPFLARLERSARGEGPTPQTTTDRHLLACHESQRHYASRILKPSQKPTFSARDRLQRPAADHVEHTVHGKGPGGLGEHAEALHPGRSGGRSGGLQVLCRCVCRRRQVCGKEAFSHGQAPRSLDEAWRCLWRERDRQAHRALRPGSWALRLLSRRERVGRPVVSPRLW